METRGAIWRAMEMQRKCVVGRIDWICIAILGEKGEYGKTCVYTSVYKLVKSASKRDDVSELYKI